MMSARAFGGQDQNQSGYAVDLTKMQKSVVDFFRSEAGSFCNEQHRLYGMYPRIEQIVEHLRGLGTLKYRDWLVANNSMDLEVANAYKNRAETKPDLTSNMTYKSFFGVNDNNSKSIFERTVDGLDFLYFGYFDLNSPQAKLFNVPSVQAASELSALLLDWKKLSENYSSANTLGDAELSDKLFSEISAIEGKIRKFAKDNPQATETFILCSKFSSDNLLVSSAINADSCGSNSGFIQSLYNGLKALNFFSKNPTDYISGFNFVDYTRASSFVYPKQQAESSEVPFPHRDKKNSEYDPLWISEAVKIAKNSIRTFTSDIISAGKVWGKDENQIRSMCSFVDLTYDSGGNLIPSETSIAALAGRLVLGISEKSLDGLFRDTQFLADVLNIKLKDGSYAVAELRELLPTSLKNSDVTASDLTRHASKLSSEILSSLGKSDADKRAGTGRYSVLGAKISYIMDARNTLANKEIIKNFILIPALSSINNHDNSGVFKWKDTKGLAQLNSLLADTGIKFSAESRRTCEVPLPENLSISGWDKEVLAALAKQDLLRVNYTGISNTSLKDPASTGGIMGADVVSVLTYTNTRPTSDSGNEFSINNFVRFAQSEAEQRHANGTFSGVFENSYNNLLSIVSKVYVRDSPSGKVSVPASSYASDKEALEDGFAPFYYLEDEGARRNLLGLQFGRKIGQGEDAIEIMDYVTKNYLSNNRFTGVSAYVPQKLIANTTQPNVIFGKNDLGMNLDFSVQVQTRTKDDGKNGGFQLSEVTSSGDVYTYAAIYSPNSSGELKGSKIADAVNVENGRVPLEMHGLPPTTAPEKSTATLVSKKTEQRPGAGTSTASADIFLFDLKTERTDQYYAYMRAYMKNNDAQQLAGDSYDKIFPNYISEQMQTSCAGWTIDVKDTRSSPFSVERVGGGEIFWYSQSLMPSMVRMGDTITPISNVVYVGGSNGRGVDYDNSSGLLYVGVEGSPMPAASLPVYKTKDLDGKKLSNPELMGNIAVASNLPAALAYIGTRGGEGAAAQYYLIGEGGVERLLEPTNKSTTGFWTISELSDPQTGQIIGSVKSFDPPNKNESRTVININVNKMLANAPEYEGFIRHTDTGNTGNPLDPNRLSYKHKYTRVDYSATLDTSSDKFLAKGADIRNLLSSWSVTYDDGVEKKQILLNAVLAEGANALTPKYRLQYQGQDVFYATSKDIGNGELEWSVFPLNGSGMDDLGQVISPHPALNAEILESRPVKIRGGN